MMSATPRINSGASRGGFGEIEFHVQNRLIMYKGGFESLLYKAIVIFSEPKILRIVIVHLSMILCVADTQKRVPTVQNGVL